MDDFWGKWLTLYLLYLQRRYQQTKQHTNFEIGDLVIIMDQSTAKSHYPLAQVIKVYPDQEGIVRRVML